MTKQSDSRLKCSFCTKNQDQVKKLIAGPGVFICDQCVDLCNEILVEEGFASGPPSTEISDEIHRLESARNEILRAAMQSESWTIRRVAENSAGIQVFIQNDPLGATIEEKVLYASALDDLVKDRCLQHSSNETYQVTWKGLIESKRVDKRTTNKLVESLTPAERAELLSATLQRKHTEKKDTSD